jgi:hypothetical protein
MTGIFVSVLALLFTLYSFWWMNWRKGDLVVGAPRTCAAACSQGKVIFWLPLVLYNSGPRPILIENLQLRLLDEGGQPLFFNAISKKLGSDEDREFATQFPIEGNKTLRVICEFQKKDHNFGFCKKVYCLALDARLDEKDWIQIKEFKIPVNEASAVALATGRMHTIDAHYECY